MRRANNAAFTLIELLVVMAIIAILAAILFPVFANAKERARMATCTSNVKTLSSAFRMYADSNGGKLPCAFVLWVTPLGGPDWCGCVNTGSPVVNIERSAIWNYCGKNKRIFVCPTDSFIAPTNVTPVTKDYPLCYSMNWMLGTEKTHPQCGGRGRVAIDTVRYPTKVLMLIHEGRRNIDDGCFYWAIGDASPRNQPSKIHYGGTTASYLDGHAKWLGFDAFIKERDSGLWDPLR